MQKRILWAHIGPWKTGSTSIQSFLHAVRRQLLNSGFLFPCEALDGEKWANVRTNHSHIITGALERDSNFSRNAKHGFRNNRMSRRPATEVLKKILQHEAANVILSAEDLSALSPEDFMQLVDLAHSAGRSIRVLGFARDPVSYVSSMSQQMIMSRDFTLSDLLADLPFPRYRSWFEKCLLSDIHTTIEPFGASAGLSPPLLESFSAWLQLPDGLSKKAHKFSRGRLMESASLPKVVLKSGLNEFAREFELSSNTISSWLENSVHDGPRFEFPDQLVHRQWGEVEGEVAWLKRNFGIDWCRVV